ncbi:GNAT family N-acetyltransferase [Wenxinia saemankumensis]|uniref:Predicted N-acetyltransferase YhbS n=1 Tax=Wenxinia saemankumensis TaxID=1447782 RepID=A0A1M6GWH2_9RHOB|nr:N-acetyltransferase [Wenxinia saemankumensis]SHJ14301.1 Predicted N-acetyltransferase YhbS [Wenxinia saemankumensis]
MAGPGYHLRQERPADWWEVEALYDTCFAPGRTALSSYRLREGVDPVAPLCLVAHDGEGVLAGAIRVWPVRIGGGPAVGADGTRDRGPAGPDPQGGHGGGGWPALLLGPVAVHPTRQGEGLGALLMFRCLGIARNIGWARVMLVGDYPYYRRFGFRKLAGVEMPPPTNPDRVLGIALSPGGWVGVTGEVRRAPD